jgi:hypothetical protein
MAHQSEFLVSQCEQLVDRMKAWFQVVQAGRILHIARRSDDFLGQVLSDASAAE